MSEEDPDLPREAEGDSLPFLTLVPNMVTTLGLCAGLTAIRFIMSGQFLIAVWLVLFAVVVDGLDGLIARRLKATSDFGAQLDSLSDFLNFGVAPALTLYAWTLSEPRGAGWIAVLVYAICCVMRLARFNVGIKTTEGGDKRFFTGVPAPAGALLVLFPIFATKAVPGWPVVPREAISAYMFVVGGLMISKLPTPSLKAAKVRADHARYVLVAVIAIFAALVTYPWVTLFTLDVFYIVTVLVALVQWRRTQPPKAG